MKRKKIKAAQIQKLSAAALILLPAIAGADTFQAPYGPGGTWRIYETVPGATLTFKDALDTARLRMDPVTSTVPGDLVSVTSANKETFVRRSLNLLAGDVWIGLTDREGVAAGATESQAFGTVDEANRINGWAFTNGDAYTYRNWSAGEPNDAGAAEDAVHFGAGGWNDNRSGYATDEPVAASGASDETNTDRIFRYIIEYATNSPSPFAGIRRGSIFPPGAVLPGPLNTVGNWSVREVRDLVMGGNIFDAVNQALGGLGTVTETQSPKLDYADPDTNAAGGPNLTTPVLPFLTDTAAVDDDNILNIAKSRLKVNVAGEYTIQVRSDDGFALRIQGQNWTSVAGAGYIDPLDPSTIVFELGTGDSNTRAVVNLPVGEYNVDFVNWEGGGGAFYEVTSASGVHLNAGEAQWTALGDPAVLPAINTLNAVYLKTNVQVDNANIRDRGGDLPAMRAIINKAIEDGLATSAPRSNLDLAEGDPTLATDLTDESRMPFNNSDGTNADNYITKVEGSFKLDTDANGNATAGETIDVTFRLSCDDGASVRIIGQDFAAVSANSTNPEVAGDKTLTADFYTGDTNSFGRIKLKEGNTYEFVAYMYEGGGGSRFKLEWELGDHVAGFGGSQSVLRTLEIESSDVLHLVAPATVTNSSNKWDVAPVLPEIRTIMNEAIAQVPRDATNSGTRPIVLLRESGDGSITGATFAGTAALMPVGAVDNYATKVRGRLVVDNGNGTPGEMVDLTFGMFADDGADFHIIGQDFTGSALGGTLEEIGADTWLVADIFTGNTNAFGQITLAEGEYDFEGHHYEGGGGSGYEIWWSLGTKDAFDGATFRPLSNNVGLSLPANTGIALAAGIAPPASALNLTNFSFAPSTGVYSLTFDSNAGSNYQVEYTIGLQAAGGPASPQKWNVVPSLSSVPATGASTTVTGNISALIAPTGQLPNGQKAFFRVRAL